MTDEDFFERFVDEHSMQREDAYEKLALAMGCEKSLVQSIFDWKPSLVFSSRQLKKKTLSERKAMLQLASYLRRFITKVSSSDSEFIDALISGSGVDMEALENLRESFDLWGDVSEAPIGRSSKGGKNWAAHYAAEGIAELFERLNRPITFGHMDGEPTTDYGRSVKAAFEIFRIDANWREPARKAFSDTKLARKS